MLETQRKPVNLNKNMCFSIFKQWKKEEFRILKLPFHFKNIKKNLQKKKALKLFNVKFLIFLSSSETLL